MTAEVAVMNRFAVALAADSYVSVKGEGNRPQKTYEVNKLFTLSKYEPVGVMVYGNAEFMGIPWETAIKVYRKNLGRRSCDTIIDYAHDFLDWIAACPEFNPEARQTEWFVAVVYAYFELIASRIDEAVESATETDGPISQDRIMQITNECIRKHRSDLDELKKRPHLLDAFADSLSKTYSTEIDESIHKVLKNRVLSTTATADLRTIAVNLFFMDASIPGASGVVIAGFGTNEVSPVVQTFTVYGAAQSKPIMRREEPSCAGPGAAAVIPFAQQDVVHTFLRGINSDALETIVKYQQQVFNRLPAIISESIDLDEERKNALTNKLQSATSQALGSFHERLMTWLRSTHVDPLLSVLEHVPKEELAELAESLVSLTTVKRKISLDLETVGGPIDVAVISKGDGLIWMKRKHYFEERLNYAFRDSYFDR